MSMDLTVRVVHRDAETASAVVAVTGELDACNQERVESTLRRLIAGDVLHVLVDAATMTFCDISGMRMLARAHRELRDRGGELVIIAHEAVHKLGQLMWPAPSPSCPAVFLACEQRPGAPAGARHTSILRGLGRRSGPRRERNAADGALPGSIAPDPVQERRVLLERRSVLERSARLREEMQAERGRMLAQAETTCAILAEVHERLADMHAIIEARRASAPFTAPFPDPAKPPGASLPAALVVPVRSPLTCDGHSHLEVADRLRDRRTPFEGYLR
ncbi:hypothetical protein GCM10010156_06580 [Planobispora rosea]|uniref:STAS domain-containing protein n=1 Tax=Planobispora rosea TaxID=35762 RepID=A0A8J3RWI2_PLARO|nr:STAS domain-containing protein [Planobispora rosea]GGS50533.1 hypothetical protein GCM10010156_06580 [Planobispora rosea]GIH82529.1 hypothetical protein Pro02_09370 [Planobispora rosea]